MWERKLRVRVKELAAKGVYRIFEKHNKVKFVKTDYQSNSAFTMSKNKLYKHNRRRRKRK